MDFEWLVAQHGVITFDDAELRFADCTLETALTEAAYIDCSAEDAESEDFVRQLRSMRNAGSHDQASGVHPNR